MELIKSDISSVRQMFCSKDDVINTNAFIEVESETIPKCSVNNIYDRLYNQNFSECEMKDIELERFLNCEVVDGNERFNAAIDAFTYGQMPAVIDVYCARQYSEISYVDGQYIEGVWYDPKIQVDLSNHQFNCIGYSGVRINTGLIIKVDRNRMQVVNFGKKTIVDTAKPVQQQNFVILTKFETQHKNIAPCIYARHADDTGLLTINFTVLDQNYDLSQPIVISLVALEWYYPTTEHVQVLGYGKLFSTNIKKNSKQQHNVKFHNDIKFIADSVRTTPISQGNRSFIKTHTSEEIVLNNVTVLASSLMQEWMTPDVLTQAGFYGVGDDSALPVLAGNCSTRNNTHSLTFVRRRFCVIGNYHTFTYDKYATHKFRILNDAFMNVTNYNEIIKYIKQCQSSLTALKYGAEVCNGIIKNQNVDDESNELFWTLLGIFDTTTAINSKTSNRTLAQLMQSGMLQRKRSYSKTTKNALQMLHEYTKNSQQKYDSGKFIFFFIQFSNV